MEHLDWLLKNLTLDEINYLYTHPLNGVGYSVPPIQIPPHTDSPIGKEPKQITDNGLATVEYSSSCPFNSHNTAILILYNDVFALHDSKGALYKVLPDKIHAMSEPRWDKFDPNLFYFIDNNKLCSFDISKKWNENSIEILCEFKNKISGKGESDISFNGKYLVLLEDEKQIILYNLFTNEPENYYYWDSTSIESLYLTPYNSILVSTETGIYKVFNGTSQKVCNANGHKDVLLSQDKEYLIWTNSNDPNPISGCKNGIVAINLHDFSQKCLLELGWITQAPENSYAVNISCSDNGVILVSLYSKVLEGQIIKLDMDGNRKIICYHKSKPHNSYNWQPRASISRDGTRFIFNSNMGKMPGTNYSEVFLMEL